MSEYKFKNILEFKNYLKEQSAKFRRYEFISPMYSKSRKPKDYQHFWLFMNDDFHLFVIKENTTVEAFRQLAIFLEDFIDGLYPEEKAAFKLKRDGKEQKLVASSLKLINNVEIYWKGRANNDDSYFSKPGY